LLKKRVVWRVDEVSLNGEGKKLSSHFEMFLYLFHITSDEEKVYITIVHLENIYNF
jgi:hypothetical protein